MAEPKYKIGQWVMFQGRIGQVAKSDIADYPIYIVVSDNSKWYLYDWRGVEPVVIYPDYGEVFCKDCEYWEQFIDDDGDVYYEHRSENCLVDQWVDKEFFINSAIVDESEMQPPPNCHCFKPRAK